MSSRNFPTFKVHEEARCFGCGGLLEGEATDTGYAPGRGRFKRICLRCKHYTFYDLDPFKPGWSGRFTVDEAAQ